MASLVKNLDKLRVRSDEVDIKDASSFKKLTEVVTKLKDILRDSDSLVALSAPQINENMRVFCIKFLNSDIRAFINPLITYRKGIHLSREVQIGVSKQEYIVPRNDEINATYLTPLGEIQSNKFEGLPSEVFQQMTELLDGVPLSDYALEVIPGWDEATNEERAEVIDFYLKQFSLKHHIIKEDIKQDKAALRLTKVIDVLTRIKKGEIEVTPIEDN